MNKEALLDYIHYHFNLERNFLVHKKGSINIFENGNMEATVVWTVMYRQLCNCIMHQHSVQNQKQHCETDYRTFCTGTVTALNSYS